MDIVNLLISLVSGAAGGNVVGAAAPEKSLGTVGNSLAGLAGGGLASYLAQALNLWGQVGTTTDLTSILANVGTSGIGGAALVFIISLIKKAMNKA
jgi:uncharacterized membrane protein YeaQ/YmgE (transglycosylase-associated protein family)